VSVFAFWIIGAMLTLYVLLDGFDLGVATIAPLVAKNDPERRAVMASIGPFWNGNEVWLVAAGGTLFAFFPQAYASSFSGFYLPFMVVLWLLMGRGVALELRDHYEGPLWHSFWDCIFTLSSVLLIVFFGVALGNLIRGVPLDMHGYFQGTFGFLLNWYAVLVGIFAVASLSLHGARFLLMRVEGALADRTRALAQPLWIATIVLFIAVTASTFAVHHVANPWVYAAGAVAFASLIAERVFASGSFRSFLASSTFLAGLLVAAAGTLFPYLVPGFPAGSGGISVFDAAPNAAALAGIVAIAVVGLAAVVVYGATVFRAMAGKVRVGG
jgi:cytochrome d ubiquinol oxidase subunit II